jgi:hypothetical protein
MYCHNGVQGKVSCCPLFPHPLQLQTLMLVVPLIEFHFESVRVNTINSLVVLLTFLLAFIDLLVTERDYRKSKSIHYFTPKINFSSNNATEIFVLYSEAVLSVYN